MERQAVLGDFHPKGGVVQRSWETLGRSCLECELQTWALLFLGSLG